jgi:hypothetical protein
MTSGRCAMLLNAVSPSMSGMQARFQFVYAVCTLLYDWVSLCIFYWNILPTVKWLFSLFVQN